MDVVLPDGTLVRATSSFGRDEGHPRPSFGLYLDPGWQPGWPSVTLDWPESGLPADWEEAAAQIELTFERAQGGQLVEIGCRVGLGRTGTVLGCMAALAGVPALEALGWVRKHYYAASVETSEQAAWIRWFASWVSDSGRW